MHKERYVVFTMCGDEVIPVVHTDDIEFAIEKCKWWGGQPWTQSWIHDREKDICEMSNHLRESAI